MFSRLDMTDCQSSAAQAEYLRITPWFSPVVQVPQPMSQSLGLLIGDLDPFGGFELVPLGYPRPLPSPVHEALVRRSLSEYGEIWRRLADR